MKMNTGFSSSNTMMIDEVATIEVPVVKTAEQENLPALIVPPSTPEETTTAPQAVQPSAPQIFGNSNNPFTGNSIQTSFSIGSQSTALPNTNTTSNVLWGGAAAAMLGATLAEWQKRREEEAARLAALRNSGGGGDEEGDSDAADKKRMKVLARVNPAYARSLTQERNTRAAIAKVTAQELKGTNISLAQAQARQQAQWDANGQAIYAANQQFKGLDSATKDQAIKDATVNGVFNAGLYSANLNTAQQKQQEAEAAEKAMQDYRIGERNTISMVQKGGGGKPLAAPASQTDDWLLSYEREAALEMYRIGEQNPNFTFDEVVATLALRKFRVNDPNFFRFDFDNDNWGGIDFPGQSNCSNFLSQIWWQAGIRFPPQGHQIWDGQYLQRTPEGIFLFTNNPIQDSLYAWYRTPQQQALFSQKHGEFRIVYNNVYDSPSKLRSNSSFAEIIDKYPQIFQPGSAVFYYDSQLYPDRGDWAHASMIVRQTSPATNLLYTDSATSSNRPAIVEQDGRFDYVVDENGNIIGRNPSPNRQIRSIDDTVNQNLTQISVVPASVIKPDLYNLDTSTMQVAPTNDGKTCFVVDQGGQSEYSLLYCPANSSGVTP